MENLHIIIAAAVLFIGFLYFKKEYFSLMIVSAKNLSGPNKYIEDCGPCLPNENNPDIWEQQCVVKNSQGYNLDYYTMSKTCASCHNTGHGVKSCSTFQQPQNIYTGTAKYNTKANFCS